MYIFLLVIHIFVCLMLILVVLFQAGRGGGMSDMFGGGSPSSLFGTQTNVFLTRATEVCAVVFVITSVSLGVLTTRQSKSLMDRVSFPASTVAPAANAVTSPKPLEVPKTPQVPEAVSATATAVAEQAAVVVANTQAATETVVANTVAPAVEEAAAIAQTTVTTTTANAVTATAPAEKTR